MTAATIKLLLEFLPKLPDNKYKETHRDSLLGDAGSMGTEQFILSYSDLGIGWKAVKILVEEGEDFPGFIEGDDDFLFKAYLFLTDRNRYQTDCISEAVALASPRLRSTREVLNSMLVQDNYTYEEIAKDTALSIDTIIAYEKLFFNVMDRHLDHMFLRNVVYPDGRFVEMYENYLENEEVGKLLMRVGYNNDKQDILHFAGFKSGLLNTLSAGDMPNKLEAVIMANGYLLAKNGWANQREHAHGLTSARNLIAAAKHGGESSQESSVFEPYGQDLIAEVINIKKSELNARPKISNQEQN